MIAHAPVAMRGQIAAVSADAFVHALNDILLIAAVIAFAGAALSLALIRRSDFADIQAEVAGEPWTGASEASDLGIASSRGRHVANRRGGGHPCISACGQGSCIQM